MWDLYIKKNTHTFKNKTDFLQIYIQQDFCIDSYKLIRITEISNENNSNIINYIEHYFK